MTIEVAFYESGYRTCKDFYLRYVTPHLRGVSPRLVSYTRFVELMVRFGPTLRLSGNYRVGSVSCV